jgi:G3E family GTPase
MCLLYATQGAFAAAQAQTPQADSNHTVKYGIETFVYSRRRAFHPQKLSILVKQLPVRVSHILALASDAGAVLTSSSVDERVSEPEPEPEPESTEPQIVASTAQEERLKKLDADGKSETAGQSEEAGTTGPLSTVIRSKGFSWLATHHTAAIYWSHAGTHFELKNVGTWWASADMATLPGGKLPDAVAEDFDGEFGDRRQEIVFIGVNMDKEAITAALDGELLDATYESSYVFQHRVLIAKLLTCDCWHILLCHYRMSAH